MVQRQPASKTIIDAIVSHITSYANLKDGVKVYAYEVPKKHDGDYIVVNSTGFPQDRFDICEATVNVNVHAKDNLKGDISRKKIDEMTDSITALFQEGAFVEGSNIYLSSISMPYQDEDSTHFINIKLTATYSNF